MIPSGARHADTVAQNYGQMLGQALANDDGGGICLDLFQTAHIPGGKFNQFRIEHLAQWARDPPNRQGSGAQADGIGHGCLIGVRGRGRVAYSRYRL